MLLLIGQASSCTVWIARLAAAMQFPSLSCVVSVSGFRGVVGETIDPVTITALAAVYGQTIARRGRVIVGRDSRPTGAMMAAAVCSGLQAAGCDVVDIGVVPTPTVPIMIKRLKAAGGIQISASHNPVEWNALKLFNRSARNINRRQLDRLLRVYARPPAQLWQSWSACGALVSDPHALDIHLSRVLDTADRELIAGAEIPVLIDSVNGAGSHIGPRLLTELGAKVTPLYTDPTQIFPRNPEPTADNVVETGRVVKAVGAAVGFVQDPDADRLALIDERGRYIGEEYTLVLAAWARLLQAERPRRAVLVTNLSTSRMLDDVAAEHRARVVRTAVGEANVVDAIQGEQAVLGGEGNGGVIDPRVVLGRDSHVGMALILSLLARTGRSVSQLVASIPRYAIHKEKVALDRQQVEELAPVVSAAVPDGAQVSGLDGYHFSWPDRWVHIRASGTEPVSRIIAEAPTVKEARALAAGVRQAAGAQRVEH